MTQYIVYMAISYDDHVIQLYLNMIILYSVTSDLVLGNQVAG